jgi:hypothetical protein
MDVSMTALVWDLWGRDITLFIRGFLVLNLEAHTTENWVIYNDQK